jgi:hypothetical protein
MIREKRSKLILTIVTTAALMVGPALVATAGSVAAANPDFGSPRFMWHLQEDLGMAGPRGDHGVKRPCPTVRGVPIPASWGRQWRPQNKWMRHLDRHGYPPGQRYHRNTETPDQKWQKHVKRYRAWLINHRYDGSRRWHRMHDHFLQYLEQNWYNYWHRLRYGQNPPNHDSNYFGWGHGREGW